MKLVTTYNRLAILAIAILSLGLNSCEKYNQVDNASSVKIPYTLFMGGYNGTLHKTNDALYYNTLFSTDNSIIRQVIVADSHIIYLKKNVYYSKDDGNSFPISSGVSNVPYIQELRKYYLPNSGLYDPIEKKVYVCTNTDAALGVAGELKVSTDLGVTFTNEANWTGAPIAPTSITQLKNGDLYIIQDTANIYKKQGTGPWTKVNQNSTNPLGRDTTAWYISHTGDTLMVIDYYGKQGVYYSTNGFDWFKCTGNPKSKKILFGNQAFDNNSFYIGYDSAGLYRLQGINFVKSGAGIPWYAKVGFAEGKSVTYRTNYKRNYVFCATDQGLYMSETDGLDWRVVRAGQFSTLK